MSSMKATKILNRKNNHFIDFFEVFLETKFKWKKQKIEKNSIFLFKLVCE